MKDGIKPSRKAVASYGAFADAAEVECTVALDGIGDLGVTIG